MSEGPEQESAEHESAWSRVVAAARRLNRNPKLVEGARETRRKLPGDDRVGDRLSTAQGRPSDVAVRQLADLSSEEPGVLGEVGLTALQLWQAAAEAQGRGRGEVDVAVLFTDLVGFSSWALEAGDELAVELLREVSEAIEPPVAEQRGEVVKRLGDGLMAAFRDADGAVRAALDAHDRVAAIEVGGHRPRLRTGIHLGRPRRLGGDYFGVDVNVAARLAQAAKPDEILISGKALETLEEAEVKTKPRRFRAKGAPQDLDAHSVQRAE